jgi:acetyl esterase/lipase
LHVVADPDGYVGDYPTAAADVAAAVQAVRAHPQVDDDRVVLWFFSGGGLLSADWLRQRPSWLRGVAMTYPVLAPVPGRVRVDARFQPCVVVAEPGGPMPPILLTRVGLERPEIASTVAGFVSAATDARVSLEIVDVPNGRHGFDMLDHTDESRAAVERAVSWVHKLLMQ